MTLRLLTEHRLEFLSLKGACTGPFEYTLVKMPHCWKSHVTAKLFNELTKGVALIVYEIACQHVKVDQGQ